jgi:hypothetical protein
MISEQGIYLKPSLKGESVHRKNNPTVAEEEEEEEI